MQSVSRRIQPTNPYQPIPPEVLERSLVDRFEHQAEARATHLAVKSLSESLTYAELNERANRLARAILARGDRRQEPVILLLSHGPSALVGILGVLKSANYVVPLDPAHPPARLRAIVQDSGASLIVVDSRTQAVACEVVADSTVEVMSIDDVDASLPSGNLNRPVSPDDRWAVHYTSGSTGQPKAAAITHRQALTWVRDDTDTFRFTAEDKLAWVTSYSFGATGKLLFSALANGAVLCSLDVKTDGLTAQAAAFLLEEATILWCTPTLFRYLVQSLPDARLPAARIVVLTGEPVTRHDARLYARYFADDCLLVNAFGATEIGGISRYFLDKTTPVEGTFVPIGFPMPGIGIRLLDPDGNPVPPGEIGEIVITGRPPKETPGADRRTASAYRRCPDGEWGYWTGDRGRMRADGMLEHHGRNDSLVKIRGQRVETAEVEMALLAHDQIQAAVVVAFDANGSLPGGEDETRLVAYVVSRAPLSNAELRQFVAQQLPDYMVPSLFVPVEKLPLTNTGKVNRAALPAPDWSLVESRARPIVEPATWIETRLVALWSQLLGIDVISTDDSFFDLGGSSLLAARMLAIVEHEFGKPISLAALEQHSTVSLLAALIEATDQVKPRSSVVTIRATGSRLPLFCVPATFGYTLDFFTLARYLDAEQPVYAFQQRGLDGLLPPHDSMEQMAADYIEEMRRIQPHGPYFIAGRSFGGTVAWEMARQLAEAGESVGLIILFDTAFRGSRAFNLQDAYLGFVLATLARLARDLLTSRRWRSSVRAAYLAWKKRTRESFWRTPSVRVVRANRRLYRKYAVRPYTGSVLYFTAKERRQQDDRVERWAQVTDGVFDVISVPGNHVSMLQEPHVRELARHLDQKLRDAQPASAASTRVHQNGLPGVSANRRE